MQEHFTHDVMQEHFTHDGEDIQKKCNASFDLCLNYYYM